MIKRLLREPLLHFLLLGLALFVLHAWMAPAGSGADEQVVITRGRIEQITASFALMHQRQPTQAELDGLVTDAIREEIFYREARALGLDQDDTIVRRRLRQKLEFVSEDLVPPTEATQAQLQAFLQANPERFRQQTRYTFSHAYLDPQQHGASLEADIAALSASLVAHAGDEAAAATAGDPFLLGHRFDGIGADELSRLFGQRFELALQSLPLGEWSGPVPSGYGTHLVRLDRRDDARMPSLSDIRDEVRDQWTQDQRRQANERFYAALLARYEVTVEAPDPAAASAAPAASSR